MGAWGLPNEMKNETLKIAQFTYYSIIFNISTYYGTFLKKYKNICSCYNRFLIKGKLVTILNRTKKLKQLIFYFNLKASRTQNDQISLDLIYNETCGMADFVNVHVGSFVSLHRTMRRHRRQIHSVTPQSMTEFHLQLTGEFAHFSPSFGNERHPLYVIMGITFNTGFPIGFALMSRKTERAYTALFKKILSIVPEAAIAAIRTMFPNTTIRGCWFHYSQAVWKKVANIGLIDKCSNHRGAYDTVHMLMAMPLLPTNCINVQSLISNNNDYNFTLLFKYYRSTWLAGINVDILSVSDTVWQTNNVLEVSHRHFQMHMQNWHNPEPWVFLKGPTTYSNGVLNDYNEATDGGQVRDPQWQVWIDQQRNLDRSLRLFTEGRYSMSEFLICARHSTATFGAPLAILPLPVYQHQELQLPAIPVLPATCALPQAPLQEVPALLPLHVDQHQEIIQDEIMRRILPCRPPVPVPRDNFYNLDADADYSDEDVSNKQSIERVDLPCSQQTSNHLKFVIYIFYGFNLLLYDCHKTNDVYIDATNAALNKLIES
ncbi:hypothetical protein QTP88_012821 [Uroleucon formosanum]